MLAGYIGDTFYYLLLAAAAFSIRESRFFKLAVIFGAGALIAEGISCIVERTSVFIVSNFIACAFLGIVTLQIGATVYEQTEIRKDTIMGGLCVYVLMGIFWMLLFMNLEFLRPGSFNFGVHGPNPDLDLQYTLLMYYSFVTLLTIGYGDVVPMSGMAQSLTILEGLIGQFYLVFFMASLVGLYIYRRESGRPRGEGNRSDEGG
ncbi:MAG: potassium channel family protein [Deltaproteobacteria bacterium]|nr:potassium channel family protein [Deltaproteobacteria bacterium]